MIRFSNYLVMFSFFSESCSQIWKLIFYSVAREMKEKGRREEIVREGKEKKWELYTSIEGLHYTISSKEKSSWKNNNAWDGMKDCARKEKSPLVFTSKKYITKYDITLTKFWQLMKCKIYKTRPFIYGWKNSETPKTMPIWLVQKMCSNKKRTIGNIQIPDNL